MKRNLVIVLGVISLIADIITMTSALKWVLINWLGVEEKNATSINTIIIVIATACLLLTLLYACWYTYEKFKKARITGSVLMIIFQDRQSINGNVNETSNELQ